MTQLGSFARLATLLFTVVSVALAEGTVDATADTTTTAASSTTGVATEEGTVSNHQEALVEWLLSKKGGYFNDKVQFKPLFPGGPNGMFAGQALTKNETVMIVPNECLLTSDLGDGESYQLCDTARHLVKEYQNLPDSKFKPYVNYIFDQQQYDKLPSAWSEAAQQLLEEVIGDELEPQRIDDVDFWVRGCGTNRERMEADEELKQLYTNAYRAVISRSWNDVMIPVYDMVNHRNGHYHNLDQYTTCHGEEDVVIVTLRDVEAGEQLYISYNECLDEDCEGMEHSYILSHIMKDYGFVEQYPRRWRFTDDFEDAESGVLMELEQDEGTGEISLTWLSEEPDQNDVSFLRGHWQRQQEIHQQLLEEVQQLNATYERDTILDYHQALMAALELAIQETGRAATQLQDPKEDCVVEADGSQTCTLDTNGRYDDLQSNPKPLGTTDPSDYSVCSGESSRYMGDAEYEHLDETESFYQTITFEHNEEMDDTCLYLSSWLQTCTSWRPHYHESVVHVPASFLDNVTRVIYLGGGDNMLLHEIIKYSDTLEMVLGMELDQQVVRSSFRNLGNQPHFDNPKVQWWFGDATKSLNLLPKDYFGTFDLVIVDLQTNVIETLQVTPTKNIMDVALDLLKPEGILARNEDFYPRRSLGFTKYEVDLEYLDVPMLCQQSITMGSKELDFLAKKPNNHGVETFYLQANATPFSDWFNYRNTPQEVADVAPEDDIAPAGKHGVHLILEVENCKLEGGKVQKSISNAISQAGFAEMDVKVSKAVGKGSAFFLFQEGYLLAQFWPKKNYVGFHLKLWDQFEKLETIKAKLIDAVQGRSSSSFRIVTGGMYGLHEFKKGNTEPETDTTESQNVVEHPVKSITYDAVGTIAREAVSLVPSSDSIVAVVCPEKAARCASLESLYKQNVHVTRRVIPVYACPGLTEETMFSCEKESLAGIMEDVKAVGGKIGGILFDGDAPMAMGQILHTLLSDKSNRIALLQKKYIVAYLSPESTTSWQRALLERFQADFDPFSPALQTQVFFNGTAGSLELGVFSSGDRSFFARLVKALETVEQETGLGWDVSKVEDGIIGYVAEFHPDVIPTNEDYDKTDSLRQWASQSSVGQQTIIQFGVKQQFEPLDDGEIVLVEYNQDVWKGEWLHGRILRKAKKGKYIVELEDESEMEAERGSIRRLDSVSNIEVMDQVLIRRQGFWSQGAIIEKTPDGGAFKVRRFDSNGAVMTVTREDLVPRMEASQGSKELPSLMTISLSNAVELSLLSVGINIDIDNDWSVFWGIGSGCVIVAFWSGGNAVVTWDGKTHLDVSFFTEKENGAIRDIFVDKLMDEIPMLVVQARDDHPRGFGRVVNFHSDVSRGSPRWVEAARGD